MKRAFRLKADAEFMAENIDGAFAFLAERFEALAMGYEPSQLESGYIGIEPVLTDSYREEVEKE